MKTEIATYEFNGHSLRVFPTDDGQSFWIVVKDATDILGYRDATNALRTVPESHIHTRKVSTNKGDRNMTCVDEAGLYRLILRSNKPEAEPFMEWVTSEVLPSIRKTGSYSRPVELLPVNLRPGINAAGFKVGMYSMEEIETIHRMRAEGCGSKFISRMLGRNPTGVKQKMEQLGLYK